MEEKEERKKGSAVEKRGKEMKGSKRKCSGLCYKPTVTTTTDETRNSTITTTNVM